MTEGNDRPVNIKVGGTMFTVNLGTIMLYPGSMLGTMLSNRWNTGEKDNNGDDYTISLDRDPVLFRHILNFYRSGKIVIPCTIAKSEMFTEVDYFGLPVKKEDIRYDTDSIAKIKKEYMDFDAVFVANLKKTAYELAIEACAHELAALIISKFQSSASSGVERVDLLPSEVPDASFAKDMCPKILDDKFFQETVGGIVAQAGYAFVGKISNTLFRLARSEQTMST